MNQDAKQDDCSRLPFPDAAPKWPPAIWQAAWIWTPEETTGKHDYVCFRHEFRLEVIPKSAILRLAAEKEAALWVNGKLVDYGPPIADPRFKRYQSYDILPLLDSGRNCIAVRVYNDTAQAALTAYPQARGCLCQVEADGRVIGATGRQWRARRHPAYWPPTVRLGDTMWPEIFAANLDMPGWQQVGFDDGSWPRAVNVIAETHPLWSATQPTARFFPWVNLIPCETKPLRREKIIPQSILRIGEVVLQQEVNPYNTALRMSLEPVREPVKTRILEAASLLTGNGHAIIHNSSLQEPPDSFSGLRNATIVLDFGRLINARLGLRLTAETGNLDIGYAYRLDHGRVVPYVSERTAMADHYIARPGEQSWTSADWRHFRYLQLTFRNLREPLLLHEVWAETIANNFAWRGRFSCNDHKLTEIFDVIRCTTDLNIIDRTMDNPSRERRQYLGDCSSIVPAITACCGDSALLCRYFRNAAEGQHNTGLYRYSYPGHDDDKSSLFDHSLAVPLRLWEHYQLFANRQLVRDLWPSLDRLARLLLDCLDGQARMTLPPYGIWLDWGHMERRGSFLPLQAMATTALQCLVELAQVAEAPYYDWAEQSERMRATIPDWFDDRRGIFVDTIINGQRQQHASEHGNSLIAFWQLAPDHMIQAAIRYWQEHQNQMGTASPAWHYLPGAFVRAGHPAMAVDWLRKTMTRLEQQNLQTWPETWCLFGEKTTGEWRCRNSRAVAQGAGLGGVAITLLEELCGLKPGSPGFASLYLMPQPGPLKSLSGTRPGPDGDYSMSLYQTNGKWHLTIKQPKPRPITLDACFAPRAREAIINGQKVNTASLVRKPGGQEIPRFAWEPLHGESKAIFDDLRGVK